ncbi:MAG TPA: MMPL family transporter [Stellaceae bacterium]|nr:MMPL family transporter [Stellaceae bacterium]
MTVGRYVPAGLWVIGVVVSLLAIARTELRTDMTAFLPRSPSAGQQALVDQLRNGVVSRLILLGIEGASPDALAALSRTLAARLRGRPEFAAVDNGEEAASAAERDWVWRNRYLLSPAVRPERFTAAGLQAALAADLRLLGSDLAVLVKRSLPGDPTGEVLALVDRLTGTARPHARDGVWFSGDERRALLMLETRAEGFDIDAQQQALARIGEDFDAARRGLLEAGEARLLETGPGVFAVGTRAVMERDATRFSLLATAMVAGLLLFAYRSPRLLLLGLLPVMSGALAGIAAVALGFGFVHGITLGFGVTLIGESVDYAVYLFTQTAPGSSPESTLARIWPTLRLGVLTSVAGFGAMLFSSFAGFAQLGLFSIAGLVVAVAVTRWVLPAALPRQFAVVDSALFARPLLAVIRRAGRLRLPVALLTLGAGALLCVHRGGFWQQDLASLSPIPPAAQRLDQELRRGIGAPDVRYLIVLAAPGEQQALAASERISRALDALVSQGVLAGFDAPDRYLPSDGVQRARQQALPEPDELRARLAQASAGLPFRPDLFAPFLADVAAARQAPLLTRAALPAGLSLKLESLLFRQDGGWMAALPLRGIDDPARVAAGIAALDGTAASFVDLKAESDRLLQTYQHQAVVLTLVGSVVVLLLLSVSLRSWRRVLAVAAPLAAAVILTAALLTAGGRVLSIFNLVGLMLIVAVGSNYCLFFERLSREDAHGERSVASLALANLCTVIGFGLLSFSGIPVLHDIGMTVAAGTLACLFLSAVFSTWRLAGRSPAAP